MSHPVAQKRSGAEEPGFNCADRAGGDFGQLFIRPLVVRQQQNQFPLSGRHFIKQLAKRFQPAIDYRQGSCDLLVLSLKRNEYLPQALSADKVGARVSPILKSHDSKLSGILSPPKPEIIFTKVL
jgi:hypothetical protein